MIIFTKFHKDWSKILDFLLFAKFWACPDNYGEEGSSYIEGEEKKSRQAPKIAN